MLMEEQMGGFDDEEDNECVGLLTLWRFAEDACPQVKDTTDNHIDGTIKGNNYRFEPFRGDCPMESEDKWGKVA